MTMLDECSQFSGKTAGSRSRRGESARGASYHDLVISADEGAALGDVLDRLADQVESDTQADGLESIHEQLDDQLFLARWKRDAVHWSLGGGDVALLLDRLEALLGAPQGLSSTDRQCAQAFYDRLRRC